MLPGITCSDCGRAWADGGLAYPTIDLSDLPEAEDLEKARNVPLPEYEQLLARIERMLPAGTLLRPGTNLGPVRGQGVGSPADVVWLDGSQMFISETALQKLEGRGITLRTGPSDVSWPEGRHRFREVEAPPSILVEHSVAPSDLCERCGWKRISTPEHVSVITSSVRGPLDVMRGRDLTGWLFATDRFAHAAAEFGLTGVLVLELSDKRAERAVMKVARLGLQREAGYLYFVRDQAVWRIPRGAPSTHVPEKVASAVFHEEPEYIYSLDGDGDVTRVKRAPRGPRRPPSN